jgi:hypothetical protein
LQELHEAAKALENDQASLAEPEQVHKMWDEEVHELVTSMREACGALLPFQAPGCLCSLLDYFQQVVQGSIHQGTVTALKVMKL